MPCKRIKWRFSFLLPTACFSISLFLCGCLAKKQTEEKETSEQVKIKFGIEKAATSIVREQGGMTLYAPNHKTGIDYLEQLKNHVAIANPTDAVRYVRFRTSPCFVHDWAGSSIELEIVTPSECLRLPAFGDESCAVFLKDLSKEGQGTFGVISDTLYRQAHFDKLTVQSQKDGYLISRWLILGSRQNPKKWSVVKVRELIQPNGDYTRRIIETKTSVPKVIQWGIRSLR